jgi:hypothetical protein
VGVSTDLIKAMVEVPMEGEVVLTYSTPPPHGRGFGVHAIPQWGGFKGFRHPQAGGLPPQ